MRELGRKKNILFGTVIGYVSIILNIVAGLFFTPWIILSFGNSGYGVYTLTTSLISMFLIDFGLSNATNTFLSKYRAKGDNESINRALSIIYKIYFILDSIFLIIFVVLYFGVPYFYKGLTSIEMEEFRNGIIIVSLFSLVSFPATTFNGILNSHEKFVFLKLMDILQRLLFIGMTSFVIVLKLNLYFLILSNCISSIAVCLCKYLFIRFKLRVIANFKIKIAKGELQQFLFYTFWAALISICSRIAFNVVPNILGIIANSTSITLFNICSTIEGFVYSICAVAGSFFLPKIAELKQQSNDFAKHLEKLVIKIGIIQFLIISLIFVGFVIVGQDFIIIWMKGNTSYLPIYSGIIALILYQLFDAPQIALRSALYLVDDGVKKYAIIEVVSAVLNFVFCILLVLIANNIGLEPAIAACFSILFARIINLILKNICYKKMLSISMTHFWKEVFFKGLILDATMILVGLRLNSLLSSYDHVARFLIVGCIVVISFVLCSYFCVLTENNKKELSLLLRRKR